MQLLSTEKIGIALMQEPYLYQNRPLGIKKRIEKVYLWRWEKQGSNYNTP
jgi:hypothetical protein